MNEIARDIGIDYALTIAWWLNLLDLIGSLYEIYRDHPNVLGEWPWPTAWTLPG